MRIAWTTVASRPDAEKMAETLIAQRLAACVQVEGPVASFYHWEGKVERGEEFRLMIKFLPEQEKPLTDWIGRHHPYDTPEWVVAEASAVGEKYLSWARANLSSRPF